jgi:cell wall-associated NlpC family hydrolase
MRRRNNGMWWWLLGPVGFGAVLVLVLGVAVIGGAAGTTSAANAPSDSSGTLCTFNGTSPVSGNAVPSSAASTSGPDAAAAVSAALAQATAPLSPSALTAAEHVAGYNLSAGQIANAQIIVGVGEGLHTDRRGMQVAMVIAQTDSALNPAASINSGAIAGMFHQLTQSYPGVNLTDPVAASVAFYGRLSNLAEYLSPAIDVGQVASAMQKPLSPFGFGGTTDVYASHNGWAKSLVELLDTHTATPGTAAPAFDCLTGLAAVAIPGLTPAQAHNAQVIAAVGATRKLGAQAITIAVAVAIAESTLMNYANDGTSADMGQFSDGHRQLDAGQRAIARESLNFAHDAVGHNLDSMGLFQQRPSAGWGTPAQLMDPATSAGKFYDQLVKVPGYATGDPATIAQTVQGSNDASGGIYAASYAQAAGIVAALAKAPVGGTTPGGGGVVLVNGPKITLPAAAGITGVITAPTATVAKVITAGLSWLGEPYSWGAGSATGPTLGICGPDGAQNDCNVTGFDCSGLMLYMWAQVGINLSHFSQDQWAAGTQIPYNQALPGDMIGYPGHITMFIGTFGGIDYELEAPESGMTVRVTPVRNSPSDPHYATVSRVWAGHR